MVKRILHCLKKRSHKIEIIVKMLFKIVRRKDPIELNYNFSFKKEIYISNNRETGSLVGATIF